jgi:hypothetical protein
VGSHVVSDGSSSVVALTIGHGSRGGSTWPSGVTPVKGIHRGSADVAHGVAHPTAATLPLIEP